MSDRDGYATRAEVQRLDSKAGCTIWLIIIAGTVWVAYNDIRLHQRIDRLEHPAPATTPESEKDGH